MENPLELEEEKPRESIHYNKQDIFYITIELEEIFTEKM